MSDPSVSGLAIVDLAISPKFAAGQLVATSGALAAIPSEEIAHGLARHLQGDWGDLVPEDREANDRALKEGSRLVSAYNSSSGTRFWIITEWDRSYTTILLPQEY